MNLIMFFKSLLKKNDNLIIQKTNHKEKIFVIYGIIFFYIVLFFRLRNGVGQYWDWTFPLFKEHIPNFFLNNYLSWTLLEHGTTLSYSSDIFFRFVVSNFTLVNPEHLLFGIIITLFTLGTFGAFLLLRRYTNMTLALLGSIAIFVNPVIFYKMTAGHINFLVSYVIFIYFIYYLLFYYKKTIKSTINSGLLIAFVGAQIQFFIFAYMLLGLFILYKRKLFSISHVFIITFLPLAINWFWISNFLLTENISEETKNAAEGAFERTTNLDIISIFNLSFSDATLISQFFSELEIVFFLGLFILLLLALTKKSKELWRVRDSHFLTTTLLVFISTPILVLPMLYWGPLQPIQALLREVGHFAPVILFFALLAVISFYGTRPFFIKIYLALFIVLNISHFYIQLPIIDLRDIREEFSEFEKKISDTEGFRILSYPFWGQYEFINSDSKLVNDFRLNNTGWDSFSKYDSREYLNNYISANYFDSSIQKRLLKTYDVDVLQPYGVKYLFDFTSIYESHFNKYVPESVYEKNLSLIKNDYSFFDKIVQKNNEYVKKISPHIYEIINPLPRIFTLNNVFNASVPILSAADKKFISRHFNDTDIFFTDNLQRRYLIDFYPLYRDLQTAIIDTSVTENISTNLEKKYNLYYNTTFNSLQYTITPTSFTYGYMPQINLTSNSLNIDEGAVKNLSQVVTLQNSNIVLQIGNQVVKPGLGNHSLSAEFTREPINILQLADNLVPNPSFEEGLWTSSVQNCHSYDTNPEIEMNLSNNGAVGNHALDLISTRHIACTYIDFHIPDKTSTAIFSLQYKTIHPNSAGYDLQFLNTLGIQVGSSTKLTLNNTDLNTNWKTHVKSIQIPKETASIRLYLYSFPQLVEKPILASYDDIIFSLIATSTTLQNNIPTPKNVFTSTLFNISNTTSTIAYSDTLPNLIDNPNFSKGPWQNTVEDCYNVDNNAKLHMKAQTDDDSYLTLSAQTHVSCTHQEINFPWYSEEFFFSFEYSCEKNMNARYSLLFNNSKNTIISDSVRCSNNDWDTYSTSLSKPVDATHATLYIYADSLDGMTENIVLYSQFKLNAVPPIADRYYIMSNLQTNLIKPESVEFELINPIKKKVCIKGATTPFYLAMSESYHDQWQLQMNNDKITGFFGEWVPWVKPDRVEDDKHFELNGFLNGWFVEPEELCQNNSACTKNPDGSYDMEMVIEFFPQRWFYLGLLISGTTFVSLIGYLGYDFVKRRRRKRFGKIKKV